MITAKPPLRVLIAEDSPTQRELLVGLLEESGGFEIVATAPDGETAIERAIALKPDVVLMDCNMPRLNGFEATRRLMDRHPLPIVMTSSTLDDADTHYAFDAIRAGAVAFLRKPVFADVDHLERDIVELATTLRLMAEVKVVRRSIQPPARAAVVPSVGALGSVKVIAIAGSTGAPSIIVDILSACDGRPPVPVLIVQHMTPGFVGGFARWLSDVLGYRIDVAQKDQVAGPGDVLLAPDDHHLGIDSVGRVVLSDEPDIEGFRPSADFLFKSVAKSCADKAMGILLSGMGRDGAAGLKSMHDAGAATIVQNEASCVVFGMPKAAIEIGAARHILQPAEISKRINASKFQPRA
ncbi:MAG: response regulator [Proteobacteria bacterium]|nr:response regulator [Pseudomonadota bacterium]